MGGYAGDGLPIARAMAQAVDCLITHPNVLNGAQLYWPLENVLYVEGFGLDRFAAGQWDLLPVHQNRIALVLDQAIEPDLRLRHLQAADAARATLGLDLTDYIVTDAPLGVDLQVATSGATWGTIRQPDSLLRAAAMALDQARAEAIAVVARFPDDPGTATLQAYRQGQGVDPLAGAEAVISHLVVRTFQVPCAHAPALAPLPLDPTVAPRSAAEELGHTFLPCVLAGLSRAPRFVPASGVGDDRLRATAVDAVVVPDSACGGSALLSFSGSGARVITVRDNQTKMAVGPIDLGIPAIQVNSYLEALGVLISHRAGVSIDSLRPDLAALPPFIP